MTDPTMESIEQRARAFAETRDDLKEIVLAAEAAVASVRRQYLPAIRLQVAAAAAAEAALRAEIEAAPGLFVKPKSRVLHGVRVGWKKAKGKVSFADAAAVVKRIRRHLGDRFDELVKTTETPVKDALSRLSAAELKKIGVTVEDTGDAVVVQATDSEIDRIVDALLGTTKGEGEES